MTHTPGLWLQSHRNTAALGDKYSTQVYTEDGETIATIHWYPKQKNADGIICTYREANARLIAASPELLKALQESQALLFALHSIEYEQHKKDVFAEQMTKNSIVISKATGDAQ